ncbi:MAG: tRNA-dihydrouridine synthase family protein [Capsulimonadaceae bacterium]
MDRFNPYPLNTIHYPPDTMLMLTDGRPALILAPMDGLADAPMRDVQGEIGAFDFAVSEFLRVSAEVPPVKMFRRDVPELLNGGRTRSGLPVQVQLLGGDPGRMGAAAAVACDAGASAIDINFGCPAPTVNRHDGGATLLRHPRRIRDIVRAVRDAVPTGIPVSAKLRLGWNDEASILENAEMAAEGGAAWLTIHGRTRMQCYRPPAHWEPIGVVRERLDIPVVANGDIWSIEDFRRCRDVTGCRHFMLGRGALASPTLSHAVARELGLIVPDVPNYVRDTWPWRLSRLAAAMAAPTPPDSRHLTGRWKQWLRLAHLHGDFAPFDRIKEATCANELFENLLRAMDDDAQITP